MNVLFVASECTPFAKTGGLADVIGSLPQELKKNHRADVRVILPLYEDIADEWKERMEKVGSTTVPVGWRNQKATLYKLTHDSITYYFIYNGYYFGRNGYYGYYDDGERFVYFSRAVIECLSLTDFTPDIVHGHDWQAGLAIALFNILQPVPGIKTVFTIHNLKYQGVMGIDMFQDMLNLPGEHLFGFEWNGMLNCMKAALFHADKITTVSPSYAKEIQYPYFGEGLDSILRDRQEDVEGIINGIDGEAYNPESDPYLEAPYKQDPDAKQTNKEALQRKLDLPVNKDIPVIGIVSRLVEQKGLPLVLHMMPELMEQDVQIVVLGTGEKELEDGFSHAAYLYPDKISANLYFDEGLAHQIYAGSDFFLMPSLFEPCGLGQLIALQYETIPIVREIGGLKDTVASFNEYTGEGNGFTFRNYNAHDMFNTIKYALTVYAVPEKRQTLLTNVYHSQYDWKDSAHQYIYLYSSLVPSQ
ncbi:glycogen synthase GlgA [Bacillus sp. FJAT-44742]|uniref:glycogen synthase GlgA n=1 Tax=Bacillus sp. FJAT-44742 TaxID=2014005 RepID=UPI000C251403|nr:glycogen synthase GlgA [Bacillus sp. FJAT-44742]